MSSKIDERRQWKNVNNEEIRKNYGRIEEGIEKSHRKYQEGIS
jgi:hypothetical protein